MAQKKGRKRKTIRIQNRAAGHPEKAVYRHIRPILLCCTYLCIYTQLSDQQVTPQKSPKPKIAFIGKICYAIREERAAPSLATGECGVIHRKFRSKLLEKKNTMLCSRRNPKQNDTANVDFSHFLYCERGIDSRSNRWIRSQLKILLVLFFALVYPLGISWMGINRLFSHAFARAKWKRKNANTANEIDW